MAKANGVARILEGVVPRCAPSQIAGVAFGCARRMSANNALTRSPLAHKAQDLSKIRPIESPIQVADENSTNANGIHRILIGTARAKNSLRMHRCCSSADMD